MDVMLVLTQIVQLWLGFSTALPNAHRPNTPVNEPIFTNTIQRVVQNTPPSGTTEQLKPLKKVFLSNRSITCNDGSQSGFYLRKSHTSKKWIIFLEGGWYCFDQHSCKNRWQKQRHYMTSSRWPETRDIGGILSPSMEENPFWWNANHVFVPYCTSDAWSGTKKSEKQGMFSFMGSSVVLQTIRDLIPLGLENSTDLLLSGSSAGGIGVMLNLDFVQELLHDQMDLKQIKIRGVTDSGWFLDRTPYIPTVKPAVDAIRKGMEFWQGRVATRCRERYLEEPWRCYFGYRLYPTLKTDLFVFQWLFDEAQMNADNVGAPVTKQQWDYVHQMGDALRQSFQNVTAVFAPSCISHSMLTKRDWQKVTIDDVSIAEALHCWEQKTNRRRPRKQKRGKKGPTNSVRVRNLDDATERENKRRRKHGKNNKRTRRRKDRQNANNPELNRTRSHTPNSLVHKPVNRKQRRSFDRRCTHKKLERCSWPQCNHSCPKLHNPFTGEEMDFIELLKSFGLDMESVANALGIDMDTLNNMDQSELLNLLTQQSN